MTKILSIAKWSVGFPVEDEINLKKKDNFLIDFNSVTFGQPLRGMELQEKEAQKD